ncbi:uncharacterized protein LOC126799889 [Argentina anserina]|uniref:uncharacterized protein LOC126799889 n=1 Tax=Argentina anserina TaxID=57926 RepID=UPI002176548D|nr:uncharacterized protein LOC126799889 [Potentilla anserina]
MDDVIPQSESQSMMTPSNHSSNGEEAKGGEGGAGNGVISKLKIPTLSSGAEQNGGDREGGGDDEKSGGLITSFISNLVSPRSTKSGEFTKRKVEDEVEAGEIANDKTEQDVGENGGGVISNIISNFFNPNEEEKEGDNVKDSGNKRQKMDEEEGGKGGLIDNIVSHLPTSIPDDAAPTTDEASILIHSLVKD